MIIPELRPPAKPHIIIGSIDSGQPCKCYIGEDHEVDPYVAFDWNESSAEDATWD